eukprot:CAMPEP_0175601758 /NCGR_PEP_ID=MMETSP0096-20121207/58288_1 /TAXON_ID=311494 /ORGANISM="Alexandrium monilatum, Strain CCMP3105" /LENGTH=36 /DNA_ID= /DNA_START= /DNA_END= /DNA_ORIENTATION=
MSTLADASTSADAVARARSWALHAIGFGKSVRRPAL